MSGSESPSSSRSNSPVENTRNEVTQKLNPILRTILEGIYDNDSPLSSLRGTQHIVQSIWKLITNYWRSFIKIKCHISTPPDMAPGSELIITQNKFVLEVRDVTFPKPKDLYINMMPFKMERKFEDCYLPENLRSYWENLIKPLLGNYGPNADGEEGKVCFLTIHESYVDCNQSQRRPGLHTDNPGRINIEGGEKEMRGEQTASQSTFEGQGLSSVRFYEHHWGIGINFRRNMVEGGIYMASNVDKSCRVWKSQVQKDDTRNGDEIIGRNGDIEHLREYLGDSTLMKANTIYWVTDRTPHESLLLEQETYRQYFRLVTHQVSLWFEDHSTKNPLGLQPDPNITKILRGSKFGDPKLLKVIEPSRQTASSTQKANKSLKEGIKRIFKKT